MKPAILGPVLMAAIAARVWVVASPASDAPAKSRPSKSGRDLRHCPLAQDDRLATQALPQSRGNDPATRHTTASLAAWASDDAAAAASWAAGLEGEARDAALGVVVVESAATSPASAIQYAEGISNPRERGEMVGFALAQLAATDAAAAFDWLSRDQSDDAVRAPIEIRVLPALAESDAPRVGRLLAEGKITPRAMEAVLATTIQRWTQQDARSAAAWVGDFEEESLMKAAMPPLVGLWTRQDREAPAAWIESLPRGPARDEACAAYAAALALSAPAEAQMWAGRIAEKGLLTETLLRLDAAR